MEKKSAPGWDDPLDRFQNSTAADSPRHDEEGAVEAIDVCHLLFVSLEGFQVFNLETDTRIAIKAL